MCTVEANYFRYYNRLGGIAKLATSYSDDLSLSRLNHRLPRGQAHPEVMEGTADVHHQIADALLPQPDPVFHHATAFDTAVDMLNAPSAIVQGLVGPLLFQGAFLAVGFLGRPEELHLGERKRQEAPILQEPAPRRQGRGCGLGTRLIMDAAAGGVAEEAEDKQGVDPEHMLDGVVLVLPAITVRLCRRVLGADDASFGPVMGTRGEAGAAAGMGARGVGSSSRGTPTGAAAASETPRRWARAARERAGASPRARRAASNAGNRTWIH
jgi:hypothetical protein